MEFAESGHILLEHLTSGLLSHRGIPLPLSHLALFPSSRHVHPLVSIRILHIIIVVLEILVQILALLVLLHSENGCNFIEGIHFLSSSLTQEASVESVESVLGSEFGHHITPLVLLGFLLVLVLRNSLSVLVQVGEVADVHLSIASTTGLAALTLDWDVLVVEDGDIVSDFGWSGHKSLIFHGNWEGVLDGVRVLVLDCWSDDGFVLGKLGSRLIEFDLEALSGQHRSDDVLFVVNVSWSLDCLFSVFLLYQGFSLNLLSLNNFILSWNEADFDALFLDNGLNDGLTDVLVRRKREFSGVNELLYLWLLVNRL